MADCISRCRDPLRSIMATLDAWVTATYPDTVVTEADSIDKEGWINYSVPDERGSALPFAGVRFRRDKPMGLTVVLAARPERDPQEWVHADLGKLRPLGFALGLPRPFKKDLSDEDRQYLFDLVSQAREAVAGTA